MSMFNDISCEKKDNEEECLANAKVVSLYARKFGTGQWSFIGPGSEKKWYSIKEDIPQGTGTISRRRCWWNSQKVIVQFLAQRAHCPEVNSEAKDTENCRFTLQPPRKQLRLFFRIIVFANQLSLYGAVADMCEEYEPLHDRSGRPDMVMGQSNCAQCHQDRSFFGL